MFDKRFASLLCASLLLQVLPAYAVMEVVPKESYRKAVYARAVDEIGRGGLNDGPAYQNFQDAVQMEYQRGKDRAVDKLSGDIQQNLRSNYGKKASFRIGSYIGDSKVVREVDQSIPSANGGATKTTGGVPVK